MSKKLVSWDDVALALPAAVKAKLDADYSAIGAATPADVAAAVAALVASAPGTLDTLAELAAALEAGDSAAATLLTEVEGKLDTTEASSTYVTPGTDYAYGAVLTPNDTRRICGMDSQGRLFSFATTTLDRSGDDGATWTPLSSTPPITGGVQNVHEMSTGELLVAVGDSPGTHNAQLYLSSGYPADGAITWALVLTSSGTLQAFAGWSFSMVGAEVLFSEYGNKVPPNNARYVYRSTDSGATWAIIFDHGIATEAHVHGCCIDPYRGAIWVSTGDFDTVQVPPNRSINVSWDDGATWTVVTYKHQPTVIMAFPDCVIFGTDNAPNGILRITDPSPTNLRIEVAYQIDKEYTLTQFAEEPYRHPAPGSPALFSYSVSVPGLSGRLVCTFDGYAFTELWKDTRTYSPPNGLKRAYGPTAGGKIVGQILDTTGTIGSRLVLDAPKINMLIPAATRVARGGARTPRLAWLNAIRQTATQTIAAYVQTTVLLKIDTPDPARSDDPGELFTLVADGIIVNRRALVFIQADNCVNAPGGVLSNCRIQVDGLTVVNRTTNNASVVALVQAGKKIIVQAFLAQAGTSDLVNIQHTLDVQAWE